MCLANHSSLSFGCWCKNRISQALEWNVLHSTLSEPSSGCTGHCTAVLLVEKKKLPASLPNLTQSQLQNTTAHFPSTPVPTISQTTAQWRLELKLFQLHPVIDWCLCVLTGQRLEKIIPQKCLSWFTTSSLKSIGKLNFQTTVMII